MPKKTKDLAAELQGGTPVEEVVVIQAEEKKAAKLCGHVNKQHYNIDGELEELACTLPKGHAGYHQAKYRSLQKNPYLTKNPRAEYLWRDGAEYEVVERVGEWTDAAGTPASRINPDYEGLTRDQWVNKRRAEQLAKESAGAA